MILKERYILYFYLLLWFLYELQGVLGVTGSSLSLVVVVLISAISIFYCIKVNVSMRDNPFYFKALNLLVLMFTLYGIVYCLDGPHYMAGVREDKPYNYLKSIYNSLLPIYFFYYFSWKGLLSKRMMHLLLFLFFIVATLTYWGSSIDMKATMEQNGVEREEFVNNMGYRFLGLFPMLSLFRKRLSVQYVGIILLMTILLLCMKRGAIIVGLVCMVVMLLEIFQSAKNIKKVFIILLSIVTVAAVAFFSIYLLSSSDLFQMRLQATMQGDSSGRGLIYSTFLDYVLYDTNAISFLFGLGANATLEHFVDYAHNDWLELAMNQGMLGVCLYVYYWFAFFKTWHEMDRREGLQFAFGLLLFIFFARTFFSMSCGAMDVYSTCVLGYCLGASMRLKKLKET